MLGRLYFAYGRWYLRSNRLLRSVVAGLLSGAAITPYILLMGPLTRTRVLMFGVTVFGFICLIYLFDRRRWTDEHVANTDDPGDEGDDQQEQAESYGLLDLLGHDSEPPNEDEGGQGESR